MKKLFIIALLFITPLMFVACTEDTTTTAANTTVAPTTVAPTTVAPTTVAPTTVAPTTLAPTTVAPTTVAPTTVAPTTVITTVLPDTTAPVFFGVDDKIVYFGDTFTTMAGVMAIDDVDGSLTASITVTGTVDMATQGVYSLTYAVSDAAGNPTVVTRTITVYASHWIIPNGEFDTDVASSATNTTDVLNWNWKGNTGTMTAEISEGMAKINILTVGTVSYGTQFYLLNRTVEQGKTYSITFRVKSDIARKLQVVLEEGVGGYRPIDMVFDMTTEWQEITIEYYHFTDTTLVGKLGFFAGLVEGSDVVTTYYLDYVRVEEIATPVDTEAPTLLGVGPIEVLANSTFDPLAGVSFLENQDYELEIGDLVVTGADLVDLTTLGEYTVVYTLTDASGNIATVNRTVRVVDEIMTSSFMVVNGDFTNDQLLPYSQPAMDGWGWHGSGTFFTSIRNGVATIDVYDTWRAYYGNQFYQQNIVVTEGQTYQITFQAKADYPRLLEMNLESGSMANVYAYFELTTDWQTFTYEYSHESSTISNVKFGFFAGNIHGMDAPTTVYLDDIEISVVSEMSADTTAPQIWGIEDYIIVQGNAFDPLTNAKVYDHYDKDVDLEDVVIVSNDVDTATPGTYTVEYSLTDASMNVATYTRTVTVITALEATTSRIQFIDGDFELQTEITTSDNNQGWTLKTSGTGAFNPAEFVDERGGKAVKVTVTNVGTVPHGVQFHQMNQDGFVSEAGSMYLLTFWAKADVARDIAVQLQENAGWKVLSKSTVSITDTWTEYQVVVTNPFGSYDKVKLGFFFGLIDSENAAASVATSIYLDDVSLQLIGYNLDEEAPRIYAMDANVAKDELFDPMSGVKVGDNAKLPEVTISSLTAGLVTMDALTGLYTVDTTTAGTYVLTYTVTDIYGNETVYDRNLVIYDGTETPTFTVTNGDFETEQLTAYAQPAVLGWGWHGSGSFFTEIRNGVATIDVYDTWNVYYGNQFYQQNRTLTAGETYIITFQAKADEPRLLQMALESSNFTNINAYFELTTEMQTFTYIYECKTTATNVKFAFFAGNIQGMDTPTTVYLDDVAIDLYFGVVADAEAPLILGIEDYIIVEGNAFDPKAVMAVYDHFDKTLTKDNVVIVSNDVDTTTPGTYTVVYSLTDSSKNVATYTRSVTVITAAEATMSRIQFIDGDFELQTAITDSDNNQGWTLKISGTGAFTPAEFVDERGGKAVKVTVTNVGTVPHGVQFHQMNQDGFASEAGSMYLLTFWAKADAARDIAVQLQENRNWKVLSKQTVSITETWTEYQVVVTNAFGSYDKVKLGFFFGLIDSTNPAASVATSIYLDDISLELIGYNKDEVAPRIYAADAAIAVNDVFDPMAGVKVGDNAKLPEVTISSLTAGLVTMDVVTGLYVVDSTTAGTYVLTYTVTDIYGNETVYDRNLVIS
ncbi:MAG: DUF5011 domain-containing protein [Tenericutes bacterium]|nr:DUF5011 domain-containing protein [Mycoplasmatota bacterium]